MIQINRKISVLLLLIITLGCSHQQDNGNTGQDADESDEIKTEISLTTQQIRNLNLQIDSVAMHPTGQPVDLPGKVVPEPDQEAYVTSLIDGRVEQVMANDGDRVEKGESLVKITGSELGTLIADLQNSYLDFERQQRLKGRKVAVQKELQDARLSYASARQQLRAIGFESRQIDQLAKGNQILDAMTLRSPISGVILKRNAVQGGPVQSGDKLFRIVNLNPIWVKAGAFEKDLARLHTGQTAQISTSTYPDTVFTGKIRKIVPEVEADSRTSSVIIEPPNRSEMLKPGMFTDVRVLTGTTLKPSIPASAIQFDGKSSFVIIAENTTTFRRRDVQTPPDGIHYVEVPGIPLGTRVVTRGAFQISAAMTGVEADDD